MTLYDLLRKLVTGERIWENERADALDLIDKMEALNAFGSTALYIGQHECEAGTPQKILVRPKYDQGRGNYKYWDYDSRWVTQCKICGREME